MDWYSWIGKIGGNYCGKWSLKLVVILANLEFKKIKCDAIITCISEDGTIDDLDAIKSDIQNGFESILDDIVLERNNEWLYNYLC